MNPIPKRSLRHAGVSGESLHVQPLALLDRNLGFHIPTAVSSRTAWPKLLVAELSVFDLPLRSGCSGKSSADTAKGFFLICHSTLGVVRNRASLHPECREVNLDLCTRWPRRISFSASTSRFAVSWIAASKL